MPVYVQADHIRICQSPAYNWVFNTFTGRFDRWGKRGEDDPSYSPFGPEILDVEISTTCHGPGKPCSWCYKSNGTSGNHMSIKRFAQILDKMPPNLTQIAFGIGDIDANPDIWEIMTLCRLKGIVPNITINGYRMRPADYHHLAHLCGSVAVSHYEDGVACSEAIEKLDTIRMSSREATLQQINIHKLLCKETLGQCMQLITTVARKEHFRGTSAIVFLLLKPKGKRNKLTPITDVTVWRDLLLLATEKNVAIGFDSCSAPMVLKSVEDQPESAIHQLIEPCESGLFSLYVNVDGKVCPCSFTDNEGEGILITKETIFMQDVWYSELMIEWRDHLNRSTDTCTQCQVKGCRACPAFDITPCKEK